MNDDDPSELLALLRAEHRTLDAEIDALVEAGAADQVEIARLKKRKLKLRDQIEQLSDGIVPDIIA